MDFQFSLIGSGNNQKAAPFRWDTYALQFSAIPT